MSDVTIRVCPNGPLLVSGPIDLQDIDGTPLDPGGRSVALCRCGRSQKRPYCDGTHKAGKPLDGAAGTAVDGSR